MVGFGANRRGGRLPSFIFIALLMVIAILSFNYWTVSSKNSRLQDEMVVLQTQVKRTETARGRLEKRNSELMVQVDTHKKQIDQKEGEYNNLGNQLQSKEALIRKCEQEKGRIQNSVSDQLAEIRRLQDQLGEMQQEIMRQENHLQEYKKNCTFLEKKLEYESLQCGQQITELKEQYEEKLKNVGKPAVHVKEEKHKTEEKSVHVAKTDGDVGKAANKFIKNDEPLLGNIKGGKEGKVKPGGDAGMPGIEDNEGVKVEDGPVALQKPTVSNQKKEFQPPVTQPAKAFPPKQGMKVNQPLENQPPKQIAPGQHGRVDAILKPMNPALQQLPAPEKGNAVLFQEDKKAPFKADELGEKQKNSQVAEANHDVKHDLQLVKQPVIQMPANRGPVPAQGQANQVENVGPVGVKAQEDRAGYLHKLKQSRFFDENESPVDPQHGSKVADYNGDDGNVGEYEADKQAELAYNEEEDGDGGEEDVQDDEERDMQVDKPGLYGKNHIANDIL
nr:PREDICTED: protein CASC4 isoform X2 [Latimeria chalumnae]|eukprot:XP_005999749.1 PREDICTED: protein CASC4 isoform X2 [Latimeria chalumnae]